MKRVTIRHGLVVLALTGVGLMLSGCKAMDSMYQGSYKMMDPDKMKLSVGIKWANPMANMREASPEKRVVYLRWNNSAGVEFPDLSRDVRAGFEQAGYRVTNNPEEAQYTVRIDLRHFGDASQKVGTMSTVGGAVVGGVAGGVIGHNVGSGSGTNTAIGAAAGAVVVGGLMNSLANRNKMVEYDLVLDVRLGERIRGGVKTSRRADDGNETGHSAGFNAAGGSSEYGSSNTQYNETQEVQTQDDFLYHKNTLTVYAVRMALTPDVAIPAMATRVSPALQAILP